MKLIEDYKQLHKEGKFAGGTLLVFKDRIGNIIRFHNAKTVLDYGAGKGVGWYNHHLDEEWNVTATLYEPAVPDMSKKPEGKFDVVLCVDVVEHVPEDEIPGLLNQLFEYAKKAVVVTFCNRPAKKDLPISGGNVHITQRNRHWWEEQMNIARMATDKLDIPFYLFEND